MIEPDPDDDAQSVVTQAEVLDSELKHAVLEGCLLSSLSRPVFDLPEDGEKVVVHYPFVFERGAE